MLSVLPCAWAQTETGKLQNDGLTAEKILVARAAYTQHEDIARCPGHGHTLSVVDPASRKAFAGPKNRLVVRCCLFGSCGRGKVKAQ
jgi:hypothetical protein